MKRFVNVRFPVILACALAAGIFAGYAFRFYGADLVWILAAVPLPILIAIAATLFKKSLKILAFTGFALIFLIGGTLISYSRLSAFSKCDIDLNAENRIYKICGTVTEKYEAEYSYIIIGNATADGVKLSGKVRAYLSESYGDFCDVGYRVEFSAEITFADTFPYGKLNYGAQKNIKYTCSIYGGMKSQYRFSLFGSIRGAIRKTLFENLDKDTAAVCFAMLTGNTQAVDDDAVEIFRQGGIAHIFAVSGLHIGIVYGFLLFFCKRLKLNKFLSATICICAVFFYCGVCGFTVSSLRAAIMCTVATISKLLYLKNDRLNSLALAVMIILFATPLSLFSAGFQLSVCAMGGIIVFSKTVERTLKKLKLPNKISSGVGTAFAAQAGTLPVMLANFGYISGAGLLLNIIIIPVVSTLFSALFLGTVISLIISAAAPVLIPIAATPLEAVISFLLNAGFEKTLITGFGAGLFLPLYYLGALAVSDKLNLKFFRRAIAVACSVAVLTAFVLAKTYTPAGIYKIFISAYNGGGDIIIKSPQGNVLIVCNGANRSEVLNDLNLYYSADLSAVIILGGDDCVTLYGNLGIDCDTVFICYDYIPLQPYNGVSVHYLKDFSVCGVDFSFYDGYTVKATVGGVSVGICASGNSALNECDLLVLAKNTAEFSHTNVVYMGKNGGDISYIIKNEKLISTYNISFLWR